MFLQFILKHYDGEKTKITINKTHFMTVRGKWFMTGRLVGQIRAGGGCIRVEETV